MKNNKRLTDLEYLESQLQEVEGRLQEAVELVHGLKTIQDKFRNLAATTQQLQTQAEEARRQLETAQMRFSSLAKEAHTTTFQLQKNFENLRYQNEQQWASFRSTLVKVQEDLHTAQRSLRSQLRLQASELERQKRKLTRLVDDQATLVDRVKQVNVIAIAALIAATCSFFLVLAFASNR